MQNSFNSLSDLHKMSKAETRSISPENPTGEKGCGGKAVPMIDNLNNPLRKTTDYLGKGWKNAPFIEVMPGETVVLMDVKGHGVIQHIWMLAGSDHTGKRKAEADKYILRMYWDGEETPSVEAPVSLFFATGNNIVPVNSLPVMVNTVNALNCYWPMPFRKGAKITYTNESENTMCVYTYQITYSTILPTEEDMYFHATWHSAVTKEVNPYVILEAEGAGKYVGTVLRVKQLEDGWFGEGEFKFYLDNDDKYPTICGTGVEDYFLHSFGLQEGCKPFVGIPSIITPEFDEKEHDMELDGVSEGFIKGTTTLMYRWHIQDPINFHQNIKVDVQALGALHNNGLLEKRVDEYSSVAFWYHK